MKFAPQRCATAVSVVDICRAHAELRCDRSPTLSSLCCRRRRRAEAEGAPPRQPLALPPPPRQPPAARLPPGRGRCRWRALARQAPACPACKAQPPSRVAVLETPERFQHPRQLPWQSCDFLKGASHKHVNACEVREPGKPLACTSFISTIYLAEEEEGGAVGQLPHRGGPHGVDGRRVHVQHATQQRQRVVLQRRGPGGPGYKSPVAWRQKHGAEQKNKNTEICCSAVDLGWGRV